MFRSSALLFALFFFLIADFTSGSVPLSVCPAAPKVVRGNSVSVYSSKESSKWVTTILSQFGTEGSPESPNLNVSQKVIRCDEKEVLQVKVVLREKTEVEYSSESENRKNACHAIKVHGKPKISSRSEWGAAAEKSPSDILPITDCVIVDGSSYTITGTDYKAKMKKLQEHQINEFGSFFNNFHIADDGVVYEALGWDKIYFLRSGGLKCLRIAFVKSTRDVSPSVAAVNAFNDLLNTAICLQKLSPSYRIIPYHVIHDHFSLEANSFERNDLRKWDKCEQDTDLTKEDYEYGSFPIVFREDWGGKDAINTVYNRTDKIKFIMVGNRGVRCFTTKDCIQTMKWLQQLNNKKKKDFMANYLIADDGFAYEVFHWNQTWHEYWLNKEVMLVQFLGKFHSYLPSERAMKTFSRLLRLGLIWGYLSPEYKILSYRQKNNNVKRIGDLLDSTVRNMERFTLEF